MRADWEIDALANRPEFGEQAATWLRNEWHHATATTLEGLLAELLEPEDACPRPLVALRSTSLLGVLAFSRFVRSGDEQASLWVNALYVAPPARRRGVASALLGAACEAARDFAPELYALTGAPALYLKCGWTELEADVASGSTVMKRTLLTLAG